jgi:aryl-alcohol dehydrogenase
MRATAAVFEKQFNPLTVTEVEVDSPGPGEALVKIVAAGVCHTDAIARDGDMPFPAPGVLGHEGAGIVAAVGDGVTNVAVGDKVVIGYAGGRDCATVTGVDRARLPCAPQTSNKLAFYGDNSNLRSIQITAS